MISREEMKRSDQPYFMDKETYRQVGKPLQL